MDKNGNVIPKDTLKCLLLNCQSICNKYLSVMEHVIDEDADVVIITETWLKSNTNEVTSAVKDYGYELYHNHRKDRAKIGGGGVGVIARKTITMKQIKGKQFQSFEHTLVKCSLSDKS